MLFYVLVFFILIAILMFIHKLVFKSRMQRQLGRKVKDRELTSISAWMETAAEHEKKASAADAGGHPSEK